MVWSAEIFNRNTWRPVLKKQNKTKWIKDECKHQIVYIIQKGKENFYQKELQFYTVKSHWEFLISSKLKQSLRLLEQQNYQLNTSILLANGHVWKEE